MVLLYSLKIFETEHYFHYLGSFKLVNENSNLKKKSFSFFISFQLCFERVQLLDWKKPFILFSVSVLVDGNSTPRVAKTRQSIIKAVAITMKSAKKIIF